MRRLLPATKSGNAMRWPVYGSFLMFFLFSSFSSMAADILLEAEKATLNGVTIASSPSGFSGTGYAWEFDQDTDNILFSFDAPAGEYELTIGYYSPYGEKGYGLQVNDNFSDRMFTGTGSSFSSVVVDKYQLKEGQNTVKITKGWGYYGIDYIRLAPVSAAPPPVVPLVNGKAEAEQAELVGTQASTNPAGYSGTGYVTGFDNGADRINFNFNIEKTGLYELIIGYITPYGEKGYNVIVNAETGSGMFPANAGFSTLSAGKYLLTAGLNRISITNGWGYYGIDYIQLAPSIVASPTKIPKKLSDPLASQSTKSLFSYMTDVYGHKTISGQHDDVDYVLEKTGKEPAIGGFDLIEYSPSRVQYGSRPEGTSERYINWAKKGEGNGMLSLTWHWNAPTDLINEAPDKLWWSGFYTAATTFDLAAALADTTSDRYKLLLRDMDTIANQLKKFQDADIPVLWRPLHEAEGAWFWWGAKGPEPLKKLWRLMYDRFTNHHQLHNLIWVYTFTTGANMNWYPGDDYVDMVGMDIYTNASDNMSSNWADLLQKFNGRKLISLSESGTLPVPDKVRGYGTWWSWFALWNGDFIKKQPLDLLNKVYHDEDVITRDELPNWRMYGRPLIAIATPVNDTKYLTCQTPVITANASDAEGTVVKVEFLANGKVIATDASPADGFMLEWKNATTGIYAITAKAYDNEGNTNISAPVAITIEPDVDAPVITLSANKVVIAAEDHLLKTFSLNTIVKSVTDNCGLVSTVRIKVVSSDEAITGGGSGNTAKDIIISGDGKSVQLRAERAGTGNGRVYKIVIEAIDNSGNKKSAIYEVKVPISEGKPAIAGATAYTVYGNYSSTSQRLSAAEVAGTEAQIAGMRVFPNPATGSEVTVQVYSDKVQEAYFTLQNNLAQPVLRSHQTLHIGNNKLQLQTSRLSSGVYSLQLQKGKERLTKNIIVSK